ncbi:hypothetical protein CIW69_16470 [Enterobacter cloacae]|nr:hypothetical protein CIW69_16470 [Enterobacter cloacae]
MKLKIMMMQLILPMLLLAFSSSSFASTSCESKQKYVNLSVGSISISPLTPVGAPISGDLSFSAVEFAECSTTEYSMDLTYDTELNGIITVTPSTTASVFATNLPGVGVEIGGVFPDSRQTTELFWANISDTYAYQSMGPEQSPYHVEVIPHLKFIKTAKIARSGTLSGIVGGAGVHISSMSSQANIAYVLNGTITTGSCEIQGGQNLSIKLDDVQKSDLPSVGSTWGESEKNNIILSCDEGTKVYITFNGEQAKDSDNGSILQNNGNAQGIGVQLLDSKGVPINLGEKTEEISSSGTNAIIPVSARYIRTGNLVSGSVDSSATYTLDYE